MTDTSVHIWTEYQDDHTPFSIAIYIDNDEQMHIFTMNNIDEQIAFLEGLRDATEQERRRLIDRRMQMIADEASVADRECAACDFMHVTKKVDGSSTIVNDEGTLCPFQTGKRCILHPRDEGTPP
jgi:energy-converting hydrogenase A subunit M